MKLFKPVILLFLGITTGTWSCSVQHVDKRSEATEQPTGPLSLIGQHCQSSFKFKAEGTTEDEVVPPEAIQFDMDAAQSLLTGEGLVGHIHAAIPEYDTWVFNYQQGNFFNSYQFPMAIVDAESLEIAKTLKRHDKIQLTGSIIKNGAAQKHILVKNIKILKAYENSAIEPNYSRTPAVPDELAKGHSAIVGVHSISTDGTSLTVEYKDFVVQVVVNNPVWTKGLYRNDKIKINYDASVVEGRPLHLILDESVEKPLEVLDRLVDLHGRIATAEGCLVLFPKSPQINRDIYALLEIDQNEVIRTWTLANFSSEEVFNALSENLAAYWTEMDSTAVNFRNKMLNTGIHVRATGTLNISSPNQANPQILISRVEDLNLSRTAP